ncbi:cytochrome c3 family protein [Parasutterella excrementihominis]|uniref:cytochrome c3 family protein n=1 Tax=Parasutterella excrementihominis TaxID=487175 RepID=UPI003AB64382
MKYIVLSMAAAFSILLSPSFAQNQTMSGSMARLHANVQCAQCHNNTQPMQAPQDTTCIQCHGKSSSIQLPANVNEKNYHNSPHYGDTVSCLECHREHQPQQNLCKNCHVIK